MKEKYSKEWFEKRIKIEGDWNDGFVV